MKSRLPLVGTVHIVSTAASFGADSLCEKSEFLPDPMEGWQHKVVCLPNVTTAATAFAS